MASSIHEYVKLKTEIEGTNCLSRDRAHTILLISGAYIVVVILLAFTAAGIAPYDPLAVDGQNVLAAPSAMHLLGTDEFGRDILTRLLYGAQPSLIVAAGATTVSLVVGVSLGVVAGYAGGIVEQFIMRLVDTLLTFPPILLAMVVVGFLGAGVSNLIIVIGILYSTTFARLTYASTLQVKENEYVLASIALGASHIRLIRYHILPNIVAIIIVQASLTVAAVILLESGLSFLGLGVVPPTPSWGLMVAAARGYMFHAPWYVLFPSLVVALTVLAVNTFGDSLRDVLDPQLG